MNASVSRPKSVAGAELLRVDEDRQHPVQHPPLALVGEGLGRAGGERAAEQLGRDREAVALVLAERQDRAVRRDHGEARVGRRVALVVDDRAGRERLALVVRDSRLALRDAARREVEQERRLAGARDADAHRVRAEARVAPAPGGDDRARDDVHEVQADEPRAHALLGPVADPAEVMRVPEGDDARAVLARALDAERHRLEADHLPVALAAVEPQHDAGVEPDLGMLVHREPAFEHRIDVARDHPDAVRVVAGEVRRDQVLGDERRFSRFRTAPGDDRLDRALQAPGVNHDVLGHWTLRFEQGRYCRTAPGTAPSARCDNPPP